MRLVTYRENGGAERIGALIDGDRQIVDLSLSDGALDGFEDMLQLVDAGEDGLERARARVASPPPAALVDRDGVELLSPLPLPRQIRCFSVFETHARQSAQVMMKIMAANTDDPESALEEFRQSGRFEIPPVFYERPLYYKGNRFSVVGTGQEVTWPDYSNVIDYELELAAIIGRTLKDVTAADARGCFFGYSVFNDLTARDEQSREMVAPLGPAKGKDFDGGNVLGPCIVTADEIGDPYELRMTASINGELWTDARSDDMAHSFEDMLAYVSRSETVHAGEVFLSGCAGGGCGMEQERYLHHGDLIELEIEKIGRLSTRII